MAAPAAPAAGAGHGGTFEWIEDADRLAEVLQAALTLAGDPAPDPAECGKAPLRVLDVGCGTSELAAELWEGGRRRVHSVDIDGEAIETMRAAHADCEGLTWQVLDITAAASSQPGLEAGAYQLAVDKGTLDYLICSELAPVVDALAAIHEALADGGVLLVVSIHPLRLLRSLYAECAMLGFRELQAWPLGVGDRERGALALRSFPRPWGPEVQREAVEALTAAMDAHFAEAAPLLTGGREDELRKAFAAGAARGRLPLERAYEAMFTSLERDEYTLELFVEDLCADLGVEGAPSELALEQALGFLQRNQ